jgi:toxin ParE1/3/4
VRPLSVAERKLRLHPQAEADINDGLSFYLTRSHVASGRFLDELDAALDLIREAPDRWPAHRLGTRRYVVSSFPYCVIYRVTTTEIHVYAVAHAKRRPLYWRNRKF